MTEELLQRIGLTYRQATIYTLLVKFNKMTPARISKLTNINRTTVYMICRELVELGLLSEDIGAKTTYFIAEPFEKLSAMIEKEKLNAQKKESILPLIKEHMDHLPKHLGYSVPKVRFVDESKIEDFLISESKKWAESIMVRDKTWWGFQDTTLLEEYPKWPEYFWNTFSKDITLNILTNKKPIETKQMVHKKYQQNRNVKFWKPSQEFSATHVVAGDYVLFIVTKEHPHYLVEIHDVPMAENLRNMFKGIWGMVK
jgi:sugar-specific transcriptional regulator TrmB